MDSTLSVPCSVCGNTDMTLADGYYYCVECGTQDMNIQETIIEHTVLADGTFGVGSTRKIHTVLKEGIEMTGEWYKWHTFNFILLGLVDELIALGAKETVKMKVLWIWTKYIKLFQDTDALGLLSASVLEEIRNEENKISAKSKDKEKAETKSRKKMGRDITYITKTLLLAILYMALNMDRSDIQLSHLLRFVKEKRLSLLNCAKFAPKEIDLKKVPHWIRFKSCHKEVSMLLVQRTAIALINKLDLGPPLVPNLRKLVENFIVELCLPIDFKNLVFSLMKLVPCDFLDVGKDSIKFFKRLPEYEVVVMSYVVVGMKMCFGLDCDYDIRLSDAVDRINEEENYVKSHKLGMFSNPTDRLFSFRDWCKFMQFRKRILCENYLPMAYAHNTKVDDFVLMKQSDERTSGKAKLSDEVTMNILNKIQPADEGWAISKSEFPPTLTPLATYTDTILQYLQDPELKLLLSEDFSQYSLKYACQDLCLPIKFESTDNIVIGVSDSRKVIQKEIVGTLHSKKADLSEVFVRNCENQNWLNTKPPQPEHVTKVEIENEKESDHGYDSPAEVDLNNVNVDADVLNCDTAKDITKFEIIEEEEPGVSIFDDAFDDIVDDVIENKPEETNKTVERFIFENTNDINLSMQTYDHDVSESDIMSNRRVFQPYNFDRESTIKELILLACKNVKAPIPAEYKPRPVRAKRPREQKIDCDAPAEKRKRPSPRENQNEMDLIMSSYYAHVEKDILTKISEHVKSVVGTLDDNLNFTNVDQTEPNVQGSSVLDDVVEQTPDGRIENDLVPADNNMDGDDEESEDDLTLNDLNPKFDEKTHHTEQLYVKMNEIEQVIEFYNIEEDPIINDIIEKKIEDFSKEEETKDIQAETEEKKSEKADSSESELESDDEIPLSVIKHSIDENKMVLDNLVTNENVSEFKYWLRHYTTDAFVKNVRMKNKFDVELQENFPRSFVFVMQECAMVLGCSTFSLYRSLQNLEQRLVAKIPPN